MEESSSRNVRVVGAASGSSIVLLRLGALASLSGTIGVGIVGSVGNGGLGRARSV